MSVAGIVSIVWVVVAVGASGGREVRGSWSTKDHGGRPLDFLDS